MARVLVLDAYWNKSLAAIRCLGRFNHKVFAGECTPWSTGLFSRYVAKPLFIHASPIRQPEIFLNELRRFLLDHQIQVVLPMEEATLRLLLQSQSQLPPVGIPFGPLERIDWVRDKKNPLWIASQLGIPHPKTLAPESLEEAQDYLAQHPMPVLFKPRIGSGGVGIHRVYERNQVWQTYLQAHQKTPFPLIQELLPSAGKGLGVSFIFTQGEPLAKFSHLRLREPRFGGASTLRVSQSFPTQEREALALLKACGWKEGVAMVEFKQDIRDQSFRLMEINPRYWGSLALAIYSGVPFPEISVRIALNQPLPNFIQKEGVLVRWLIPGEVMVFFEHLKQGKWDREFFRLFFQNVRDDIWSWDDPLPFFGRITSYGPYLTSPNFALLRERH
ncbi:MAG: hypothetical protein AABZ60_15485 [Planctomycetota bacterium]